MEIQLVDIEVILNEREKTRGSFADHAACTQYFKDYLRCHRQWGNLNAMQRESLDMIVHKIGRIMAGDPNHADHWDDIAGYAKLPVRFNESIRVDLNKHPDEANQ